MEVVLFTEGHFHNFFDFCLYPGKLLHHVFSIQVGIFGELDLEVAFYLFADGDFADNAHIFFIILSHLQNK